ncbi:PepSY domain-containing protein [Halomonas citrativorans]|uniref:PepSY domain-containing protein n=1 Tax=Halomonas citrativorans TaxID=2742612 RepID=A0ABR9FAM2_9GAMM|nr:PepSY domain-containing protein [Halomonas citrativorans]MBE0403543.1 PepSY domain-containing protein [Halomonas citrativorans]
MNVMQKMLLIPASALLLTAAAGSAQADALSMDRVDEVLVPAVDYGFTHYEEISIKSRGRAEVEGWLDDEWYADVEFSLDNGETLKEERKRLITGAWGMSEEDVRQALEVARKEGMSELEDIDIDKGGVIDIEGRDENGRELEISLRQGSYEITEIDRD